MSKDAGKKVFLIATENAVRAERFAALIQTHFPNSTLYTATDGTSAWAKILNATPHVVISDVELPKLSGVKLLEQMLAQSSLNQVAALLVGTLPEQETHLDEFVTGRLQYLAVTDSDAEFLGCVAKGLNFAFHGRNTEFSLRFLAKGERLLTEGEKAESVFIVKEGRLRAFQIVNGAEVVLGHIEKGEFVGEMAYINGEARTANVDSITAAELIEVPVGTLERLLYRRPAWSKTLLRTLAKRLKKANASNVSAGN